MPVLLALTTGAEVGGATTYNPIAISSAAGYGSGLSSTPYGLNDSDQVVGQIQSSAGASTYLPFVYTPGAGGGSVVTVPGVTAGTYTAAYGINNSGVVVGTTGSSSVSTGFVYNVSSGSPATTVQPLGASVNNNNAFSELAFTGVNAGGQVVGYGTIAPSTANPNNVEIRAVSYTANSGGLTDVGSTFSGTPAARDANGDGGNDPSNYGLAINSSGVIAGYGPTPTSSTSHPFILTPVTQPGGSTTYTATDLQTAIAAGTGGNAPQLLKMAIDANGDVAGTELYGSHSDVGYLYMSGGTAVAIAPTSVVSNANGVAVVNGSPVVVGRERNATTGLFDAILYQNGTTTDISTDVPGYVLDNAYAINSNGDIVATGYAIGGSSATDQAFLLEATPEPTSLALLAVGGASLCLRRARRGPA
jgi:hypothetical protein